MKFKKRLKDDCFLSDDERVKVLDYLFEKREEISFQPEEMLFYAIYAKDSVIREGLRKLGVKLSEVRVHTITDGSMTKSKYWYEYCAMTEKLSDEDYLEIMQQLALELDGKKFHYTKHIYRITKERFRDVRIFQFFIDNFKQEKMNKSAIIRGLIDADFSNVLSVVEREGWLNVPERRDKMIAYASEKNKTEILAWLLDFKNRTADFAAEATRAEKRLMRELNAAPDSVFALRKIWSYRKREDGTLIITNYKGANNEVIVPEKIGKGIVTAIGAGAFAGDSGFYSRATSEHREQHRKIVKITLPKTIQYIGKGAFSKMVSLEEIDIPDNVKEIDEFAFDHCSSLKSITIPEGLKKINNGTFLYCSSLENIIISKNVKEIGKEAFCYCTLLKDIIIPGTVEKIKERAFFYCHSLAQVNIYEGLKEIGKEAFCCNDNLKNITIPGTVEKIEEATFQGCSKLEKVDICEGVIEIGKVAFFGCSNLKEIKIPESVQRLIPYIDESGWTGEVFEGCQEMIVYCPKESIVEKYCREKGYQFKNIVY